MIGRRRAWTRGGVAGAALAAGLAAFLVGGDAPPAGAAGEPLALCRYRQTFAEEFDGPLSVAPRSIQAARWIAHTPWNGDFGEARFIDPGPDGPFSVTEGILTIEARRRNGAWTSGLLASADAGARGFAQRFGYFEARMKFPEGPGVWPAFWLAAASPPGDTTPSVEIDVIEFYGKFPNAFQSVVHVWGPGKPPAHRENKATTSVKSGSLTAAFHTYGVAVTPDTIAFYLDRREVARMPTPPEHTKPMMLLVNLALGGGWPIDGTPDPSRLLVDYVRAYEPDPTASDRACPP